jgi:hypothetical protein
LLSVEKNPQVDAEMLAAAERTNARIREHYLGLPGKTEEGWAAVKQNPAKYNRAWRHMLKLPAGDTPPNLRAKND